VGGLSLQFTLEHPLSVYQDSTFCSWQQEEEEGLPDIRSNQALMQVWVQVVLNPDIQVAVQYQPMEEAVEEGI
jgi:hypothetical protein